MTPGDHAASLIARDALRTWHPYTQHGADGAPIAVSRAEGSWLELADSRRVIDAISSWWTCLHGHARPEIVAAIARQAATLDHVLFAGATHEPAVALAERLVALSPPGLERVFFSDDGSTAVEVALKIAHHSWANRGQPDRDTFVVFEGGYHGDTVGAMSVGDPDPYFAAYRRLLFPVARVPVDADRVDAELARLGIRAAGVLIEPLVQGAGGMRMHGAETLRGIREACAAHGVPLIADEVMTGFGRTGARFACERAGVAPDLLCVAKALTGGVLPLAATLATETLFESFVDERRSRMLVHGHSFTGNPIACAAALASLDLLEREDTPARLDSIGARIHAVLGDALRGVSGWSTLRRLGGIVAVELVELDGAAGYFAEAAPRVRARALELGCLLRPLGRVLYAMPPASTDGKTGDAIAGAMATIVHEFRAR